VWYDLVNLGLCNLVNLGLNLGLGQPWTQLGQPQLGQPWTALDYNLVNRGLNLGLWNAGEGHLGRVEGGEGEAVGRGRALLLHRQQAQGHRPPT